MVPSESEIRKVRVWYKESDGKFKGGWTRVFDKNGIELMKAPKRDTTGFKSHEITLEQGERFIGYKTRDKKLDSGVIRVYDG